MMVRFELSCKLGFLYSFENSCKFRSTHKAPFMLSTENPTTSSPDNSDSTEGDITTPNIVSSSGDNVPVISAVSAVAGIIFIVIIVAVIITSLRRRPKRRLSGDQTM